MSLQQLRRRCARLWRASVAWAWHRLGLWRLKTDFSLRGKVVVLMYHRVLDENEAKGTWSHPGIVVSRRTFERQMEILRRHFAVLSLDQFIERLRSKLPFERRACLVTFDDGWQDTYAEAFPVLKRHGIPAAVFLPSRFIGSADVFWQERLSALIGDAVNRSRGDARFAAELRPLLEAAGLAGALEAEDRDRLADVVRAKKHETERLAAGLIARLEELLGRAPGAHPVDRFMSWEDAAEMARAGVSFGSHTVTHRLLTTLTGDEVRTEMAQSRDDISRRLPTPSAFCYPSGDTNAAVVDEVRDAGYTVAFTTREGWMSVSDEPLLIPRINMHEDMSSTPSMFLARVTGLL